MKKTIISFLSAVICCSVASAQMRETDNSMNGIRTTDFPVFKQLVQTPVAGAPILGQPQRIDGTKYEIRTEKHGLGYPVPFDWNRDGKKDLLMGEFETGESGIKVYLNVGTKSKPRYTGEWFYATDINGDTLTCHQWCCIGTHPQIIDLDGDGYDDIISGQYNPGQISWWRGSEKGFLPRQFIEQQYYEEGKNGYGFMSWSPTSNTYWNFTTARFADFDGDGLPDLFVAGSGGYRVALNKGTREHPVIGLREYLFHTDGSVLHTRRSPDAVVETGKNIDASAVCGDTHSYIYPVDWDGDGVLDLLIHDGYSKPGSNPVTFFRGVKTDDGLRFEQAVPLFTVADGSKALPGCAPMVYVDDYNNDGVEDLVLGLSIETFNSHEGECKEGYEGAKDIYWNWLHELGLEFPGKDAGFNLRWYGNSLDTIKQKIKEKPFIKPYLIGRLDDMRYVTLRHRGYPVVMYGTKNPVKAVATTAKAAPREFVYDPTHANDTYEDTLTDEQRAEIEKQMEQSRIMSRRLTVSADRPVGWAMSAPSPMSNKESEFKVQVIFATFDDYHIYNNSPLNSDQVPVSIKFSCPDCMECEGELTEPEVIEGVRAIYKGTKRGDVETIVFEQKIKLKENTDPHTVELKAEVVYQTCSSKMCLPPVTETLGFKIDIQ